MRWSEFKKAVAMGGVLDSDNVVFLDVGALEHGSNFTVRRAHDGTVRIDNQPGIAAPHVSSDKAFTVFRDEVARSTKRRHPSE